MKVSDYIFEWLAQHRMTDVFTVSGGGIMYLLDSLGRNPAMRYCCNYHEQACAISAETFYRVSGRIGVCLVTTGPGGANAISGLAGAWVDSIPVMVISGQVRRNLMADYSKLRQVGPQEGNIVAMARPITKYARTVCDPQLIRQELETALAHATGGRPGPVWLDIPLDVQNSDINPAELPSFCPSAAEMNSSPVSLSENVDRVLQVLQSAQRPIVIAGNGIHLSRSEALLEEFLERTGLPVILPHSAKDLVPETHPGYMGIFGSAGQRRANFALQNSDCLLSLGTGLNTSKTGFNYQGFAPKAFKMLVDIDAGQLFGHPLKPDLGILADVRQFLSEFLLQLDGTHVQPPSHWLDACAKWKNRYPIILPEYYADQEHANGYVFMDKLSDLLGQDDVLVAGNGLDAVSYWQAFKVQRGQRTMINGNWGSMGWDLPAAIGACIGSGKKRTICVTGDGSFQWNVQELLTMRFHQLPVKLFVYNNRGYSNIRATQNAFFEGRFVGADATSGVGNPDFEKLAAAYRLSYDRIQNNDDLEAGLRRTLTGNGPALCEVNISEKAVITPKSSAFKREDGTLESRPLEDMSPFLPREEIWQNMHQFDNPVNDKPMELTTAV